MPIVDFEFEDQFQQWRVERFELSDFNLLVGRSGVGKTRVLRALQAVSAMAIGSQKTKLYQCRWTITLDIEGKRYRWRAETDEPSLNLFPSLAISYSEDIEELPADEETHLVHEYIEIDAHMLVERSPKGLKVDGESMPVLKASESIISMLRDDPRLQPLFRAFQRFLPSQPRIVGLTEFLTKRQLVREQERFDSLDTLREDDRLSLVVKARILQKKFPDQFKNLIESYQDIFGEVQDVRIAWQDEILSEAERDRIRLSPLQYIMFFLKEKGIEHWIPFVRLSSGMRLTMIHLLKLLLAPSDTVVFFDEYENSLGVNCLPDLTDHLRRSSRSLQFIFTSHHPYVINNLSKEYWKIVTRQGSVVRVQNAMNFPELNTDSHQDAFVQLLQVMERDGETA